MSIEHQYLSALELTHQMLGAAVAQDWDTLTRIEKERARIVENVEHENVSIAATETKRIVDIIVEMERESAEILERVQCWQEHAKILLRIKT